MATNSGFVFLHLVLGVPPANGRRSIWDGLTRSDRSAPLGSCRVPGLPALRTAFEPQTEAGRFGGASSEAASSDSRLFFGVLKLFLGWLQGR